MKRIIKYFLQGTLVLLPAVITVYLAYVVIAALDRMLFSQVGRQVVAALPFLEPGWVTPIVGGVVTIAMIVLVGFFASNLLGRKIVNLLDGLLDKLPLVRILHSSIKDLLGAFVGDKKKFDHAVLVDLIPGSSARVVGFLTSDDLEFLGLRDQVSVYLPQSYNFAGQLVVVPRSSVKTLEAPSSEVMTFVVSGGVAGKKP
jgi:uncharacterized membrane protein